MDWHLLLGIFSGLIAIAATIPYTLDMVRGETRPNVVSWSLWTLVVLITALAQISTGASWSLLLLLGTLVANSLVLVLCAFGYGYKKFGTADKVCLVLALAAVFFWMVTSNPVAAIVLAVTADGIGYIPTLFKVYREPKTESAWYWAALVVADVFALLSVTTFNLANALFPISYGVLNFTVLAVRFFGRGLEKRS